jgi:hypothetical protein
LSNVQYSETLGFDLGGDEWTPETTFKGYYVKKESLSTGLVPYFELEEALRLMKYLNANNDEPLFIYDGNNCIFDKQEDIYIHFTLISYNGEAKKVFQIGEGWTWSVIDPEFIEVKPTSTHWTND